MAPNKKHFVTLAEVAARAGVSPGAASVAIRGGVRSCSIGVSEEVVERVKKIAREMGYRPSATARAMCNRATRQIGVVLPNRQNHAVTSPMTFETILGINHGLQAADRLLVLVRLHDILEKVEHGSRVFREDALDGVIVVGAMPREAMQWVSEQFAKRVWCDTNVWESAGCVRRDEAAAGRMACEHAATSKFKRIVWVGNERTSEPHFSSELRLSGVREICGESGRKLEETSIRAIEKSIAKFKGRSVVAESYPIAQRLWVLFGSAGLLPGRDLSLACCDDPHHTSWAWPELARVQFDRFSMGQAAAELMLEMLDSPASAPKSKAFAPVWIDGSTII